MTMTSTLGGAPLTMAEEAIVLTAWARLSASAHALDREERDPVAMLDAATAIVAAAQDLRSTISNAWHLANRRQWPLATGPRIRRRPSRAALTNAEALAHLGLTEADLTALLGGGQGAQEAPFPKGVATDD